MTPTAVLPKLFAAPVAAKPSRRIAPPPVPRIPIVWLPTRSPGCWFSASESGFDITVPAPAPYPASISSMDVAPMSRMNSAVKISAETGVAWSDVLNCVSELEFSAP